MIIYLTEALGCLGSTAKGGVQPLQLHTSAQDLGSAWLCERQHFRDDWTVA